MIDPLKTCPELRTKTMSLNTSVRRNPDVEACGTAVYWCLKTYSPLGPDDLPALPEDCGRSRKCCELPLEV